MVFTTGMHSLFSVDVKIERMDLVDQCKTFYNVQNVRTIVRNNILLKNIKLTSHKCYRNSDIFP